MTSLKTMMILIAAPTALIATPTLAATVTVDLAGVRAGKGDLYVTLQTQDQFMKPTGSHNQVVAKPAAGSRTVTFADVAPGTYAASAWHDLNGNKTLDVNAAGAPTDGWAMLNAETLRAKPTFGQVSFPVTAAARNVKLDMRYGR